MVCMMLYTYLAPARPAWRESLSYIVAVSGCRLEWLDDCTAEVYMPVAMF